MATNEFPTLASLGLYVANVPGDGNCLFSALSDQLYGSMEQQHTIRTRVIHHMRAHADSFKRFLVVNPGGGARRNPRRKTAAPSPLDASAATDEEVDRVFEAHLSNMKKGGTYGDNMEIVAFATAYQVNVKIYLADRAFLVTEWDKDTTGRHVCHIAYHQSWEHYSSIRNVSGPHQGPPQVIDPTADVSVQLKKESQNGEAAPPSIPAWQIDLVENSLPQYTERATIIRTIEQHNGNVDVAIEKLISPSDDLPSSTSSQSSSFDREVMESSDECDRLPTKKQDRRQSRAARTAHRTKAERMRQQDLAVKLNNRYGDSLESLVNAASRKSTTPPRKRSNVVYDSEDDDYSVTPLRDGDTSECSEYSERAPIKIKLVHRAGAVPAKHKRLISARDLKQSKKREQKLAAKERRQLLSSPSKQLTSPTAAAAPAINLAPTHAPAITTTIFRTLHI